MSSRKAVDNLSKGVNNINLGSSGDGAWVEVTRKQTSRAGSSAGKQSVQQVSAPNAWGQPDMAQKLGMRGDNAQWRAWPQSAVSEHVIGASAQAPPLQHGQNRAARTGSSQVREVVYKAEEEEEEEEDEEYSDEDDDVLSNGFDSDEGPLDHETRKQQRMLKGFFEILDKLNVQEINEPERQWHCPACQGGPGAIDWYKGLQPLLTHARTKGSVRVKLHREFANLLDEELRRRGTSVVPAGDSFGQWEGLKQEVKDHEIVWPPMVVIMNTLLDQDDNDKWLGMGNQELLDYFKGYAAVRAKHSYGPMGHRGMSVLIFESSAMGYMEAERLHMHFQEQRTGRKEWEVKKPVLFYAGGKRQLYGFLARKEDLDNFNRHCQGKTRLKFELRSYQEMVVSQMKQMSEDNQQLTWFKSRVAKEQRNSKALEESLSIVSQKLRKTMEENRIVRQRTKMQHEQNKEEMDSQEHFFKEQIDKIHEATDAKENDFEKLQLEKRKNIEESNAHASIMGSHRSRAEEVTRSRKLQDDEMAKFDAEREVLILSHDKKKMEMKRRHWQEEVDLEKEFDAALTRLMEKYAPRPAKGAASSSKA